MKQLEQLKPLMRFKHWQDPINALLGAWLLLSPWALDYSGATAAMLNAVIVGVALVAVAVGAMLVPRAWEEWTEAALGFWLMAAPWVLGFGSVLNATSVALLTGAPILVLALWTLATDKDYSAWLNDHLAR